MSPGPISDTTKSAIEALKTSPMVLALLLFNIAFIALLAYTTSSERTQWTKVVELLAKTCGPAQ
jgi:hypothetical protein